MRLHSFSRLAVLPVAAIAAGGANAAAMRPDPGQLRSTPSQSAALGEKTSSAVPLPPSGAARGDLCGVAASSLHDAAIGRACAALRHRKPGMAPAMDDARIRAGSVSAAP